jgi:pyrroline-5-carboxylate reductase
MREIGIIGLGNMGEALLRTLLSAGVQKQEVVCAEAKTDRADFIQKTYGVDFTGPAQVVSEARKTIVAVKPQDAEGLFRTISTSVDDSKIIISIMAGTTTSSILSMLGKPTKVIRVMPNICVQVAEGAMGISPNYHVTPEEIHQVSDLLQPLGTVVEVSEGLMDAVTALSGSGPAFVLHFLEAMIDAGVRMGLPRDKSRLLAVQTMKGTVKMLEAEGMHPTLMKEMVTSPGGTTIAGLVYLEEKGFKGKLVRALEEARTRAAELSK